MADHRLVRLPLGLDPEGGAYHRWQKARLGMTVSELVAAGVLKRDIWYYNRAGTIAFDPPMPGANTLVRCKGRKGVALPVAARTERPCLRCEKPFPSEGPWNRLCGRCKSAIADMSPLAPYAP
ncbi:MAG TPA: hypothetical protein PKA13_10715 [Geminicoccaceae bacterium]|nr:hypothetical protein [Geminicoccus sp.]HMU50237.1 hypothetical protein [Geminicoccaceae bacterium]